jgi:hypothetical protein
MVVAEQSKQIHNLNITCENAPLWKKDSGDNVSEKRTIEMLINLMLMDEN